MRIRNHLLIMVLVCALGGVISTFGLSQMYRQLDVQQHQVGDDSLVLKDMERLKDGIDRLLVTIDLAIGGGETYLLAGARKQVEQLIELCDTLADSSLLAQNTNDLERIRHLLERLIHHISQAEGAVEAQPATEANQLIEAVDKDSIALIQGVEQMASEAADRSVLTSRMLEQNRQFARTLTWLCLIAYAIVVLLLWRWAWFRVVQPLQSLTREASRAMTDDQPFVFTETGPREIRQLATTIRAFVSSLETKVADRTSELIAQTHRLNSEIIEREKAQAEKQKAQERLVHAIENIFAFVPDGLLVFSEDMALVRSNKAFEAIVNHHAPVLDMTTEQLRQRILTDVIHRISVQKAESAEITIEAHGSSIQPEGFSHELHLQLDTAKTTIDRDAEAEEQERIIVSLKDITERTLAEQERARLEIQLRQTQKMEAIGTLAGGIAHDFNNILYAILGYTRLALKSLSEDHAGVKHVNQIKIAANRAKALVQQILTFCRKGDDQPVQAIEMAPVVSETLELMRASLPKTIDIKQEITTQSSTILADATRIHQVVMNLCKNASDAMDGKGVLDVQVTEVDIETTTDFGHKRLKPGLYVKLSVTDTGIGMDRALIDRIFEPFYTTKEVGKGTGMGLSVVHGVVEEYGGLIAVDSEVGKGTTFNVFFPKADRDEIPNESPVVQCQGQGETILLVEDEVGLANMVAESLEGLGYRVISETDAQKALERFRATPDDIHLVITDQIMPIMTGIELARAMLSLRPGLPVILCTGFSEDLTVQKAKETGIGEIIHKPLDIDTLAKIMRRIFDQKEINV